MALLRKIDIFHHVHEARGRLKYNQSCHLIVLQLMLADLHSLLMADSSSKSHDLQEYPYHLTVDGADKLHKSHEPQLFWPHE